MLDELWQTFRNTGDTLLVVSLYLAAAAHWLSQKLKTQIMIALPTNQNVNLAC